jgi:electron-transferring-flavoprotein dehydrogenase
VDEAWTTGAQLADGVAELMQENAPFTKGNLERTYVARRRASWVEKEGRVAEHARNGFQRGFVSGLMGMALAGFTKGQIVMHEDPKPAPRAAGDRGLLRRAHPAGRDRNSAEPGARRWIRAARSFDGSRGMAAHRVRRAVAGHPSGRVADGRQGTGNAPGFEDHVRFLKNELCESCLTQVCVEICSGEAIAANKDGGTAAVRSREVRALRGMPLELLARSGWQRADKYRIPRGRGRPALRRELKTEN